MRPGHARRRKGACRTSTTRRRTGGRRRRARLAGTSIVCIGLAAGARALAAAPDRVATNVIGICTLLLLDIISGEHRGLQAQSGGGGGAGSRQQCRASSTGRRCAARARPSSASAGKSARLHLSVLPPPHPSAVCVVKSACVITVVVFCLHSSVVCCGTLVAWWDSSRGRLGWESVRRLSRHPIRASTLSHLHEILHEVFGAQKFKDFRSFWTSARCVLHPTHDGNEATR